MTQRFYATETIHISADDLTLLTGGSVTTGASVVLSIADENDVDVSTITITAPTSGDDWGADLAAPSTPGVYFVKAQATKSGAVWRAKERIYVDQV